MNISTALRFAAFALAVVAVAPTAAQTSPVVRIGYLSSGDRVGSTHLTQAFLEGLRELGYVEGRNLIVESRYADGKVDQLPRLAAELVSLKADVIFAPSSPSTLAVKSLTSKIPIVFCWLSDPIGSGVVANLSRPEANVTGLSTLHREISAKRLELLRDAFPSVRKTAALVQKDHPATAAQIVEMKTAAIVLSLGFVPLPVSNAADIEDSFKAMKAEGVDSLVVIVSPVTFVHRKRIVELANDLGIKTIYDMTEAVDEGGLMSFSVNMREQFRRAATYVHKILSGTPPANLPIEQPTKFELVVNMKTAKAFGLKLPASVLVRADRTIE